MIEAMKQALEALKDVGVLTDREWQAVHKNKANELRQAIAELESQEPVAWNLADKVRQDLDRQSCPDAFMRIAVESIVKHHPPQRKPLTDEQIEDLYFDGFSISKLKDFARAIEAAHGIKE